jgi:hypothetical protein
LGVVIIVLRFYHRHRVNKELDRMVITSSDKGMKVFSFEEYALQVDSWKRERKALDDRMRKYEVEMA